MKNNFYRITLCALFLCLISCGGGDDPQPVVKPEVPDSEITIDANIISNGLSFTSESGEQSVSFSTNENWTLTLANTTSGVSWCTASPTSGAKGTTTVKFAVTENTDYDNRSLAVTIKAGTASKTFNITQKQKDALLLTTDKFEVEQNGGTIQVKVKANIDYRLEIDEASKSWIRESDSRALKENTHIFDIDANEAYEKREGQIHLKSGEQVETIKVYQTGGPFLMLSKDCYVVDAAGETITVDIQSNFEFGVVMPEVDWILDEASARGASSHSLKYIVQPNETYDNRTAQIIFYDKNSALSDTLTIIQGQKDAILLTNKECNVSPSGEILEVLVNANIDFQIEILDNEWISETKTGRSLSEHKLYFTVSANTTNDVRTGLVVFRNVSSNVSDTLTIVQAQNDVLEWATDELVADAQGGELEACLHSNVDFTIELPSESWISCQVDSRALSSHTCVFTLSENTTYANRSAQVIVKDKNSMLSDTLTIIQGQKDAVILTRRERNVSAEGEILEVLVNASVEFETEILDMSWISESKRGRGLREHKLYFTVSANTTNDVRTGRVVFRNVSSNVSDTLTIVQAQNDVLEWATDELVADAQGGELEASLHSNVDFTIELPSASWISCQVDSRALSSHTCVFTLSENTTYANRSAQVIVKDKNSMLSDTLTIVQAQNDVLQWIPDQLVIDARGGKLDALLRSNVDFTIEYPTEEWLASQSVSRALDSRTYTFTISENPTYESRSAKVIVKDKNSTLSDTLTIKQLQADVIIVSQKTFEVKAESSVISFDVSSNIDYQVEISDDWIKQISNPAARALKTDKLYFQVSDNYVAEERTATIIVTDEKRLYATVITVVQQAAEKDDVENPNGSIDNMPWEE